MDCRGYKGNKTEKTQNWKQGSKQAKLRYIKPGLRILDHKSQRRFYTGSDWIKKIITEIN